MCSGQPPSTSRIILKIADDPVNYSFLNGTYLLRQALIEAVDPGPLIADKAFDADPFIAALNDRAIVPVIPSKSNRKTPRPCDFALYCERNLVERFFNKLKHFRAIATRYDKLAKIVLAGVQLACAILLN